jgi:hypothetical protein
MKRCWYFKAIVINCFLENEKSTGYCFLIYRNRIQILSNSQAILPLPQNKNKNSHPHSENCAVLEKIKAALQGLFFFCPYEAKCSGSTIKGSGVALEGVA